MHHHACYIVVLLLKITTVTKQNMKIEKKYTGILPCLYSCIYMQKSWHMYFGEFLVKCSTVYGMKCRIYCHYKGPTAQPVLHN